jgi:hypothetical protein
MHRPRLSPLVAVAWLGVALGLALDAWVVVGTATVSRSSYCSPQPAIVFWAWMAAPVTLPGAVVVVAASAAIMPSVRQAATRVAAHAALALLCGAATYVVALLLAFIESSAGIWCY